MIKFNQSIQKYKLVLISDFEFIPNFIYFCAKLYQTKSALNQCNEFSDLAI